MGQCSVLIQGRPAAPQLGDRLTETSGHLTQHFRLTRFQECDCTLWPDHLLSYKKKIRSEYLCIVESFCMLGLAGGHFITLWLDYTPDLICSFPFQCYGVWFLLKQTHPGDMLCATNNKSLWAGPNMSLLVPSVSLAVNSGESLVYFLLLCSMWWPC